MFSFKSKLILITGLAIMVLILGMGALTKAFSNDPYWKPFIWAAGITALITIYKAAKQELKA